MAGGSPLNSDLHTPNGRVIHGADVFTATGGNDSAFWQDHTWVANFDDGGVLKAAWRDNCRVIIGRIRTPADFIGEQVTLTLWNGMGNVTQRDDSCKFAKVW
jgi:hypothetical protein